MSQDSSSFKILAQEFQLQALLYIENIHDRW